jgi:hypothetical protein
MDYAANQAFPRRRMIGDCDIDASANGPGVGDRAISDPRVCSNWLAVPASVVRHYRQPRHMRVVLPVGRRGRLAWNALLGSGRCVIPLAA